MPNSRSIRAAGGSGDRGRLTVVQSVATQLHFDRPSAADKLIQGVGAR